MDGFLDSDISGWADFKHLEPICFETVFNQTDYWFWFQSVSCHTDSNLIKNFQIWPMSDQNFQIFSNIYKCEPQWAIATLLVVTTV